MRKYISLLLFIGLAWGQVDYQTQIQTIFNANCTSCHINGGAYQQGLDLSSYDSLMAGSNNGAVIVPGDHANSLLWQKVNSGTMPPGNNPDLGAGEINLIAQWIDEGALENPVYAGPLWNVSNSGSDSTGDGSADNPFATIQYGIGAASDGDTVVIYEGVYYEEIDAGNRELTIGSLFMFDNNNESIIENTILDGENSHRLYNLDNAQVSLIGMTMQNGYAENWGGAIIGGSGDLTIRNCRFTENYAGISGGVMDLNGDNLIISNSVFYNNSSARASVINVGNSTNTERTINVSIKESVFRANTGERRGAINVWGSDTTLINNCEFIENISGRYGGGFIVHDTKYLEIDSCIIKDNKSLRGGGGGLNIWSIDGGIISNSIFSGNIVMDTTETDTFRGGGIHLWADATLTIRNCTITNNTAPLAGAIAIKHNSHCTIVNSIIWGNGSTNQIGIYDDLFDEDTTSTLNISFSNLQYGIDSIFVDEMSYIDGYDESSMLNSSPLFCNPDSSDYTLAENSPCIGTGENGANMGAFGIGCEAILSIDKDVIPLQYVLHQNYPNPFNPITTLRYDLPENSYVNVTVYDMLGREIRTLVNTTQDAGFKSVRWDATNNQGNPVSAGVYLYKIQAGEFVQTKKMVLLK